MTNPGEGFWAWIENRSKVQFYAVFTFVWLCLHWQTWVILIFVSENSIAAKYNGMLKVEYIKEHANLLIPPSFHASGDEKYWLNFGACLLIAGIVAYISVWFLPKFLLLPAYKKERDHELAKRTIDEVKEEEYLNTKKKTVKAEEKVAEIQESIATKRKSTRQKDETVIWREDYEKFKADPAFESFNQIIRSIYENRGRIARTEYDDGSGRILSRIPSGTLAMADGLGLIDFNSAQGTIAFTDKGKYFLSRYPSGR